ncbi:hypothetical protein KIH41_03375 [Litoribacter ruber]|uniref:Uncharacterized protein n=1 Tax=Litoribacter ruber TaxID=702568 RepID=A0AAP2G1P6_9BACT|nr:MULTISPECIES: hypothetical protein [Litoribacter]MBS9524527.1 hypothetical protein [Litoribacter alkaliphilus]MBT0810313.1 hypothetical protein [Litoribacter ruber]
MKRHNLRIKIIFAVAIIILAIPLFAMQFTEEVVWTISDFVAAAALLAITGFGIEGTLRKIQNTTQRLTICGLIFLAFLLVWAELAVGLIS